MGSTFSKQKQQPEQTQTQKPKNFAQSIQQKVDDEITRRMMLQREVQMAINIARARDNIYVFGSIWIALLSTASIAKLAKKPVPSAVGLPIVVGGILLGNLADMAYGNKLARVNKEAAHLLEHERARFVPFPQAPMARFYTDEERSMLYDPATAVGDMFPYGSITRSFVPSSSSSTS